MYLVRNQKKQQELRVHLENNKTVELNLLIVDQPYFEKITDGGPSKL